MSLDGKGWRPNTKSEWLYPQSKVKKSIKELREDLLEWIFVSAGRVKRRVDFDAIFEKHFGKELI